MAAFEYDALSATGATRRGVLEADSDRHARRLLRAQSLVPLDVRRSQGQREHAGRMTHASSTRLSGEQLALFTRLLGTLLKSGLPLDDALGMLRGQAASPTMEKIVISIRARVREGHTLENALDDHPRAFPDVYRATVGAGEQTRLLPLVLAQLAAYVERRERIMQKVRVALIYPTVLTVTAVLVVTGLLTYVVPEVIRVFDDIDRSLPLPTQVLIYISDTLRAYGLFLLLLIIGFWSVGRMAYRKPSVRVAVHSAIIRVPFIGPMLLQFDAARFSSTLGILLSSGVEMIDALTIASRAVALLPFRSFLRAVSMRVREGESLSSALADSTLAPPLLYQLIRSGESSGDLSAMLETASETFDHKTERAIAIMLSLLEPLLIFAMGAVILFIVIAIMLPIFEMNQFV